MDITLLDFQEIEEWNTNYKNLLDHFLLVYDFSKAEVIHFYETAKSHLN